MSDNLDLQDLLTAIEKIPGVAMVRSLSANSEIGIFAPGLGNCNMYQVNVYIPIEADQNPPTLGIMVEDGIKAKAIFNPKD